MSYSQRFRYGNLVQMYSKFRDIFRKRMKQKEEGTVQRHFGAAAREIEKERARKQAAASKSNGDVQFPFAISFMDPDQETSKTEQLFMAFRSAKEMAGENTEKLTIEAFRRFVRQKTEQIQKQESAREVEYIVTVESNQARLKARAKS
jgi:hypothetical protein